MNLILRLFVAATLAVGLITAAPAPALAQAVAVGKVLLRPLAKQVPDVLPVSKIDELADLARQPGGTKLVGNRLGELRLSGPALDDAYLRIAIRQGHIQRAEAHQMIDALGNVPGFRSALSKIIGNSAAKSTGHLNELRIANTAARQGFKVDGIGVPFDDLIKRGSTDMDVLLSKNGRRFAVEAKDYAANTPVPLDAFRADMDSLVAYRAANSADRVHLIFSITNKSVDGATVKLLKHAAKQRGVELLYGDPQTLAHQIEMLARLP